MAGVEKLDPKQFIIIKGARVHNLKNIDVAIPRNKFVVITGLSGSGKSSLAFDTLYAEDSEDMWRVLVLMRDSLSDEWTNPMLITSKVFLLLLR